MRLSNYISAFFVPFFKHCASPRSGICLRKKTSESRRLPVLSRALNTYIRVFMGKGGVQTLDVPWNVGTRGCSIIGAWDRVGPMDKVVGPMLPLCKSHMASQPDRPLVLFYWVNRSQFWWKKKSVFFLILIMVVWPDFAFSTILVFLWDLVIFLKTFFSSLLKKNFFFYFLMEITYIWKFLHFATFVSLFYSFKGYLKGFLA